MATCLPPYLLTSMMGRVAFFIGGSERRPAFPLGYYGKRRYS
jgi:hypothetical protein